MDAIEKAGCGHPGLPLGCAEIAAYLYGTGLNQNPKNPNWKGRDRFILSAGHGSTLLYSALHLAGFDLSLEDLKNFRQFNAPTAGHPEYGHAPGVETTTGPLGQGIATGAGMALAQKMAAARIGIEDQGLLDGKVVVLAGDGCIMEGISAETSSLAGHLGLNNLILFYDANDICLDGPTDECFTEDTAKRYEAYNWSVTTIDGHDFDAIETAYAAAKISDKPTLIIAKTTIGKGAPNVAGSSEAHGKAMGAEEVAATKEFWNIPQTPFHVPSELTEFFKNKQIAQEDEESKWQEKLNQILDASPEKAKLWTALSSPSFTSQDEAALIAHPIEGEKATRNYSAEVIQYLGTHFPYIAGGSADLSCSDNTYINSSAFVTKTNFKEQNIKYGVREFAMGAMSSGIALHGMLKPFCGTFLIFSDYMRNAIRLAALMNIPVIYQFTHDSVLLGEDGPTHQPVEQLASLRALPNLTVFRPADATETKAAWAIGLTQKNPTAIILSRQKVKPIPSSYEGAKKGAYIIKQESQSHTHTIFATGAELSLAIEVAEKLEEKGQGARVISLPSFEIFDAQGKEYQKEIVGSPKIKISIEAQSSFGWHKYIGEDGIAVSVDQFGKSAPASDLARDYGLTCDQILNRL